MSAPDVKALYQALVLDHGKNPRHQGPLPGATHEATVNNPLCGDRVTVRLLVEGGVVRAIKAEARGCMIAKASASIMSEIVAGKDASDARDLAAKLDAAVNAEGEPGDMGALEPLRGVRAFPARRACATIAWSALADALSGSASTR